MAESQYPGRQEPIVAAQPGGSSPPEGRRVVGAPYPGARGGSGSGFSMDEMIAEARANADKAKAGLRARWLSGEITDNEHEEMCSTVNLVLMYAELLHGMHARSLRSEASGHPSPPAADPVSPEAEAAPSRLRHPSELDAAGDKRLFAGDGGAAARGEA